ncbi:hypothetical protein [Teredinibacter haidensis]|uniref:hypothetical protein n=1 Tax=Teredinibacter haidensis TaxID=2731755 RepID=UPI000B11D733|nr:hypothetical protein [Teredinibacter haidensis]
MATGVVDVVLYEDAKVVEEDILESSDADSSGATIVNESMLSKELERQRLQSEIDAFLAHGGKIDQIPPNVVADPPKKPGSNYGGQPI